MWEMLLLQYVGAVRSAAAVRCCDLLPQEGRRSLEVCIQNPWAVRGGHRAPLVSIPATPSTPSQLDQQYPPVVSLLWALGNRLSFMELGVSQPITIPAFCSHGSEPCLGPTEL